MPEIRLQTTQRVEAIDITGEVRRIIGDREGRLLNVYTPHTTCGIMINEHADPAVVKDVLEALDRLVPAQYPYRHSEGNSDAHIKSALVGCSSSIPCEGRGRMLLGTWQGIFFMEFDGPRERRVIVTLF